MPRRPPEISPADWDAVSRILAAGFGVEYRSVLSIQEAALLGFAEAGDGRLHAVWASFRDDLALPGDFWGGI